MISRIGWAAAMIVGGLLGIIGVIALPVVALTAGVVVGSIVGAYCFQRALGDDQGPLRRRRDPVLIRAAIHVGVAGAAAAGAGCVIVVGTVAVLGAGAAVPIVALVAAGVWMWRRRPAGTGSHDSLPPDRHRDTVLPGGTALPGGAVRGETVAGGAPSGQLHAETGSTTLPSKASTAALCALWRSSYWRLHDLGPGPGCSELVELRRRLLDELEHRDPAGFHRWLQSGPRAGSDPGRYMVSGGS